MSNYFSVFEILLDQLTIVILFAETGCKNNRFSSIEKSSYLHDFKKNKDIIPNISRRPKSMLIVKINFPRLGRSL